MAQSFRIEIAPSQAITALAYPAASGGEGKACLILAHGAGGSQASPLMVQFATALAARGIATLTFNFLYSENRRRLPDRNDKLEACYRKVIEARREGSFGPRFGAPASTEISPPPGCSLRGSNLPTSRLTSTN